MTLQRKGVLILTRHLPALRDLLGRQTHAIGDPDGLIRLKECGVEGGRIAHHGHHAHGFGSTREHDVGFADPDPIGRHGDRAQAGGAKAVHGHTTHGIRQPGAQHRHPRNVQALLRFRNRATNNGVLDRGRVQARDLRHGCADGVSKQVVRARRTECAAMGFANRRAGRRNDISGLQGSGHDDFLNYAPACRSAAVP